MEIADTLSRACLFNELPSNRIDGRGNHYALSLTSFTTPSRGHSESTAKEIALQTLSSTISNGWPENKNSIPVLIGPYFDIKDE